MITSEEYSLALAQFAEKLKTCKESESPSNILLFRVYMNGLLQWKEVLKIESKYIKSKESHNLFLDLNPRWVDDLKSLEEFSKDVNLLGVKFKGGRFFNDIFAYMCFYWELYKDRKEIQNIGLANPYDSLLKIIETGSEIYTYHGRFNIGHVTFNNLAKYKSFKLPSISDDFLNFIDTQATKHNKIPNQKEVDQLWQTFNLKMNKILETYRMEFSRSKFTRELITSCNAWLSQYINDHYMISSANTLVDDVNGVLNGDYALGGGATQSLQYARITQTETRIFKDIDEFMDDESIPPDFELPTAHFKVLVEAWRDFLSK